MAHRLPLSEIEFTARFATFCRVKGDVAYDPTLSQECALAQFGYPGVIEGDWTVVPKAAFRAAVNDCDCHPRTFAALADRLEALLIDAPMVARS